MKRCAIALCLATLTLHSARADEGMWMPQQIPALADRLKALGFQGDPNAFADLTGLDDVALVAGGIGQTPFLAYVR